MPITNIAVSRNKAEEQLKINEGYSKLTPFLSHDEQGNFTYIWYKEDGNKPITRIQVSGNDDMSTGLINAGYEKVFESPAPGSSVFLWSFKGTTNFDTPIIELRVSTNHEDEALKMKSGFERVGHILSATEDKYLWVKRKQQTYICDVNVTNSSGTDANLFQDGYIRIDQSTSSVFCGCSSTNFLWYRLTTDAKSAITDLKISTSNDVFQQFQQQGYKNVGVNLNEGSGGNAVYLWYKKEKEQTPLESMLLLFNKSAFSAFQKAGITPIPANINDGNNGPERYLCLKK